MSTWIDIDVLKRDLHGMEIGTGTEPTCDFCKAKIDIDEPVMSDVIRVIDLPYVEEQSVLPSGWVPDVARCPACEIETIEPATKGFDEAYIGLHVSESNGVLSIDASSITIVDHSPHTDGYKAAFVVPPLISVLEKPSMARWVQVEWSVRESEDPATEELGHQIIKYSDETPPDLANVTPPEL